MGTTSKALTLLDYFDRTRQVIGLSDLARLSGVNKATCFRLMTELVDHGLAEQIVESREYRIGPAVLRLAALREAAVPLRDLAMPILQRLAQATGETAHMSHLVGGRLATLAYVYSSTHAIKVMMEDAEVLPFHATSSGYAVLAHLPVQVVDPILAQPLPQVISGTPVTAEAVRARIKQVRQKGYAQSANTYEAEVASLAVPLFDARGTCLGAVAVAAPVTRMTPLAAQHTLCALIAAAREAMAGWGGQLPPELDALWRQTQEA
ncbi:MAG: IclR family transcriptional regulator [Cypionkella sp.]